jgi:tetratricopeptide (TPR) repeat protein
MIYFWYLEIMKKYDGQKEEQQQKNSYAAGALRKLPLLIVGGIAVLLVVGAIVAYFVLRASDTGSNTNNTDPSNIGESPLSPQIAPNVQKAVNEANAAASDVSDANPAGQKEAGVAVYQKAIESATNNDEEAALWVKQAEFLSAQGDEQAAIAAALKAQEISGETLETTTMLALLYEMTGDNDNAAIYYRKAAVEVVKEGADETLYNPENEAAYFREKADQLESQ